MTYDRSYTWAKEYKFEIISLAENSGFKICQIDEINVEEIKRPIEKTIKIKIQKIISKINLMRYGNEFGESITLTSNITNGFLNCKGWFLDDHLIGLEIEYNNIEDNTFKSLKNNFEKKFNNYEIIWTRLPEKNAHIKRTETCMKEKKGKGSINGPGRVKAITCYYCKT